MTRLLRPTNLATPVARGRLQVRKKEYFFPLEEGLFLAYRKVKSAPGTWAVRRYVGDGRYVIENLRTADGNFVIADDAGDRDGNRILSFADAQQAIRARFAKTHLATGRRVVTVRSAVQTYQEHLISRGGDPQNAARILMYLPKQLAETSLLSLEARDFEAWWARLRAARLASASINRTNAALKACLNLAATSDNRVNPRAWDQALRAVPEQAKGVTVRLTDEMVRSVVTECYAADRSLGQFVHVAADSGARATQIMNLRVRDLMIEPAGPFLNMPASNMGRGSRARGHRKLAISSDLASSLHHQSNGRDPGDPLLLNRHGRAWSKGGYKRDFGRVIRALERSYGPSIRGATLNELRQSAIVRVLLAGVPVDKVADDHDTSVAILKAAYSNYIGAHSYDAAKGASDPGKAGASV